jgi:hypothetical protein
MCDASLLKNQDYGHLGCNVLPPYSTQNIKLHRSGKDIGKKQVELSKTDHCKWLFGNSQLQEEGRESTRTGNRK